MVMATQLHSRNIREMLEPRKYLNDTKQLHTTTDNARNIYSKIANIKSTQSKTKLLRLVHGDVYCGSRLKKFGLSDNDRCHRCFAEETISHLLLECPYTIDVWHKLGISPTSLNDLLTVAAKADYEILSYFVSELVFRKKIVPPDVLIRTIITSFSKGLCRSNRITERATNILRQASGTGTWNFLTAR
jgi:hypothetical protein